jgi:hypothetical protein
MNSFLHHNVLDHRYMNNLCKNQYHIFYRTTHAQQTRHEARVTLEICVQWMMDTAIHKCSYDARNSRRCCANVTRMLYRRGALHMRDIRVANTM